MKKLKLNISELKISSFVTTNEQKAKGTVKGNFTFPFDSTITLPPDCEAPTVPEAECCAQTQYYACTRQDCIDSKYPVCIKPESDF
ncbi:MAG: pinensin family lanthipeptide [Rhodothermaceae bacterium]